MLGQAIYTVEEVSRYLRVPLQVIQKEIADGRLSAKNFGGCIRISESALTDYMNGADANGAFSEKASEGQDDWLHLQPGADFDHKWPDATVEHFGRVREGTASYGGRDYHVKLGFTVRETAGRPRTRCLVLVDRYPTVEFVKADRDKNDEVGPVAGIIKNRSNKHIPATALAPPEYEGVTVGPYREVVDGPGAAHGLGVICSSDDFETMVKHALIQYGFRQERP